MQTVNHLWINQDKNVLFYRRDERVAGYDPW